MAHYIAHFIDDEHREYIVILDEFDFKEYATEEALVDDYLEHGGTWRFNSLTAVEAIRGDLDNLPTGVTLMKKR